MRRRHKILLTLGAVLGVMVVAAGLYHWHLKAVNEAYLAQLVEQGEPMTLAQVLPPAVPPAENSAAIYLKAVALLEADTSLLQTNVGRSMRLVATGKALAGFQLPAVTGYDFTNSWAETSLALKQNQPALELLQQLVDHPALDFHIHYEKGVGDGFDFNGLNATGLKKSAQYLSTAVTVDLHNGDTAAAVRKERAMLVLAQALQYQRFIISELVAIAIIHIAQGSCWEILQSPNLADQQLAAMQSDWEQLNLIQSWQNALAMERVADEINLSQQRADTTGLWHYLGLVKSARTVMGMADDSDHLLKKIATTGGIFLWRFWWSYPDELRCLKGYQVLLEASRLAATNVSFHTALTNQKAGLDRLQISDLPESFFALMFSDTDFHSMLSQSVASLSDSINSVQTAEALRQMTVAAIALQRFKLARGHFPSRLAELIPDYVAVIPVDPVDGRPLRYHLQTDGNFLLYSVGANGVDDGGNAASADHANFKEYSWLSFKALDWVWPQPVNATNPQP